MAVPQGNIFALATELLDSAPITYEETQLIDHETQLLESKLYDLEISQEAPQSTTSTTGATCITCGVGIGTPEFANLDDQRRHFKSDWHNYNVKRKLAGLLNIPEDEFINLVETDQIDVQGVGSISGNESLSDTSVIEEETSTTSGRSSNNPTGPHFVLPSTGLGEGNRGIWRCLVAPDRERGTDPPPLGECTAALKRLIANGARWAIILSRGGHFSAAIFDVVPSKDSSCRRTGKGDGISPVTITDVLHKSFHKYVVRAKAGGKQSTQDGTGKYAKSAGSRLRRHNEMALENDIASTLTAWKETLASCNLIFFAAPGSNSRLLFVGDAPLLDKADQRIRKVPFVTRRPTFSEAQRVVRILLTVYCIPQKKETDAVSLETTPVDRQAEVIMDVQNATRGTEGDRLAEREAARKKEEEARAKNAEKRARQKERQREQRKAAAAAAVDTEKTAGATASPSKSDELLKAALQATVAAQK